VTLTAPFTSSPFGVATDTAGHLYVSVQNLGEVLIFNTPITASSMPVTTVGPITPPAGAQATWVTLDAAGNMWVADQINQHIYEFNPPFGGAAPNFTITSSTPAFGDPEKISFDSAGDLIVPQFTAASVYVFRPPFTATPTAAAVLATCAQPLQTVMTPADWLLISCTSDGTIRAFKPPFATGNTQAFAIAPPVGGSASGMTFDAAGNLYVAYDNINMVAVFAPPFGATSTPLFTFASGTFPGGLVFAP
jgi:streptogramin lyase